MKNKKQGGNFSSRHSSFYSLKRCSNAWNVPTAAWMKRMRKTLGKPASKRKVMRCLPAGWTCHRKHNTASPFHDTHVTHAINRILHWIIAKFSTFLRKTNHMYTCARNRRQRTTRCCNRLNVSARVRILKGNSLIMFNPFKTTALNKVCVVVREF